MKVCLNHLVIILGWVVSILCGCQTNQGESLTDIEQINCQFDIGNRATCNSPENCTFAEENPDLDLEWYFTLDLPKIDQNEQAQLENEFQKNCLSEYFSTQGMVKFTPSSTIYPVVEETFELSDLAMQGTYSQIQEALSLEIISSYTVLNPNIDCSTLTIKSCSQDPYCRHIMGRRFDPVDHCNFGYEPAGCESTWRGCGHIIVILQDPEGNCWLFNNTCTPEGWGSLSNSCQSKEPVWSSPLCQE